MIYTFKSKAAGDVIMLGPHGDELLRAIGREPSARGTIAVGDLPAAIAAIQAAVERSGNASDPGAAGARDRNDERTEPASVTLRQRAWPLLDLMERAHAAGARVVWGI